MGKMAENIQNCPAHDCGCLYTVKTDPLEPLAMEEEQLSKCNVFVHRQKHQMSSMKVFYGLAPFIGPAL